MFRSFLSPCTPKFLIFAVEKVAYLFVSQVSTEKDVQSGNHQAKKRKYICGLSQALVAIRDFLNSAFLYMAFNPVSPSTAPLFSLSEPTLYETPVFPMPILAAESESIAS